MRRQLLLRVVLTIDGDPEDKSASLYQRVGREGQEVGKDVAQMIVDLNP